MYGIIMAGGVGKRFWPLSRQERPKQFLKLFGDRSMIQMTYDRLQPLITPENIFVITNKVQKDLTIQDLPGLPESNIVSEPLGKDTAPCIGVGAIMALERDPDAVMAVLPADHLITDEDKFREILKTGEELARANDCLITIGIEPTRPETGYGYIQIVNNEHDTGIPKELYNRGIYKVKTFAEKPNLDTAKRFIQSGDFLWNSGIFIWKASTIISYISDLLPELHDSLMTLTSHINKDSFDDALLTEYRQIKSKSIDYGVMEKAQNVFLLKASFDWSDVGSWEEYYNLAEKDGSGNVLIGNSKVLDSDSNLIYGSKKLIAGFGLEDMIVVDTDDVTLICPRGDSQKVKQLFDFLKQQKLDSYL